VRVHISAKWSDLNTRKEKAKGRATSLQGREVNVTAGIAACSVGAMTSLLLLVIMYTERTNNGNTDRTTNLLISSNVHYVHLAEIIRYDSIHPTQSNQMNTIVHMNNVILREKWIVLEHRSKTIDVLQCQYNNQERESYKTSQSMLEASENKKKLQLLLKGCKTV